MTAMTVRTGKTKKLLTWPLYFLGKPLFLSFSSIIRFVNLITKNFKITKKTITTVAIVLVILFLYLSYLEIFRDLPNPNKLVTRNPILTTKIYDRNGKLLYKIYRNQNRTLVQLNNVPLSLREAIISIEDKEFYSHQGLSYKGIIRSTFQIIFEKKLAGGSTITQQLVKNALLTPERTWKRKIKEIILAMWVEARFTKDQILQMYLNEVGFGGASYGVEEASQLYFGKSVKKLTLSESALLAGLPALPTVYSPFGARPELAAKRQEQVLRRMAEDGYITQKQEEGAKKERIALQPHNDRIQAPHFVMYIKEMLVERYGERMVNEGGLEVRTSLDLDIQNFAQNVLTSELEKLKGLHVTNGGALVTNPKTGEILAMVGSKDYFDTQNQGNFNVTTALRQPGSSIKPVNYAVALSMGFTQISIIPDTPITYNIPGQPPYAPRNYDNRYHGNVTLRTALGSSYNIPAVKVLSATGVNRMIEQGKKMGITTWDDSSRFGLSLTLGGGEVKMIDMATVYGTLANLGTRVNRNPILEVKTGSGRTLEQLEKPFTDPDALSPQIAYILTDILSDNSARTPTFGQNSLLVIKNKTVAVKTGTTNNLKDNWTIGYTPSFLVAVWVGNNDASPMSYIASGITGASPIWHNIMTELLKDKPDEKFNSPDGITRIELCSLTNTLSCGACPFRKWGVFLTGTEPSRSCSDEEINAVIEARNKAEAEASLITNVH